MAYVEDYLMILFSKKKFIFAIWKFIDKKVKVLLTDIFHLSFDVKFSNVTFCCVFYSAIQN